MKKMKTFDNAFANLIADLLRMAWTACLKGRFMQHPLHVPLDQLPFLEARVLHSSPPKFEVLTF